MTETQSRISDLFKEEIEKQLSGLDLDNVLAGALIALDYILGAGTVAEVFGAAAEVVDGEKSERYRRASMALGGQTLQ